MEQGSSDESKTAATANCRESGCQDVDENHQTTASAHSSAFDGTRYDNELANANEEIHLDYDGLSDDNMNDTASSSEKKVNTSGNENVNDDEIHLTYDGASDDTLNNSKNSNKEEDSLNEKEHFKETSNNIQDESIQKLDYNEDESRLASDDNGEESKLELDENEEESQLELDKNEEERLGNDYNEYNSSFVADDHENQRSLSPDDNKKSHLEHDDTEEINRLDDDSISNEKHARPTQKDKQTIQSEQQRLQREAQFSIPYHKPKKYTLQEFLNRRTIMKPAETVKANSGLERLAKSRNLKMTKEELEIYSKLMEDRAKEASEFFKAENLDNTDATTTMESSDAQTKDNNENFQNSDDDSIEQSKSYETSDNNKECEKRITSNVIITEVLELPKLDLDLNVATDLNLKEIVEQSLSPQAKKIFPLDTKKRISTDILKTSPVLNKNVDITIDLFSNEEKSSKPISRANSLLERLMKSNNYKPKPKEDVRRLLSPNCNAKSLIEKTEPSLNKKPGETFLQLKDNLKSLIMKKRREEIMKKQEEDNDKKKLELDEDADFDELNDEIDEEEFDDEVVPTSSENSDSESDAEESAHDIDDENGDNDLSVDDSQQISAAQVELRETDIVEQRIGLSFNESEPQDLGTPVAISQIPATQIANQEEETDQLINLCSGTFETQPIAASNTEDVVSSIRIISSSDDEENSPISNSKKSRTKKFTKKVKKSKMKLGFSDDEDDDNDEDDDKSDAADAANDFVNVPDDDDDLPATYIDYDSEENEITVELTKEDCLKRAENFVEKEAELSDSEWGSADEDEKNLDQYDIELGDEDEFDKEEVRAELEKIHARKMLDEDIRQVNKLQEILFEDEEDESAKRQRKFRWKNTDTAFNIDMSQNQLTDLKPEDGSDDENEHLWRKIRYEREQAIKNNSQNEISLEASTSTTTPKASSDLKNLTILSLSTKTKISGTEEKEKSPFLISKELIKCENIKARSSFLLRNKKTLTKTICSVRNGNTDVHTSPDKIGVKAINPSKFVFTTLSLEEHETLKRKADDANAGIDIKISKRVKSEVRKSEYLIDKLL